MGFEMDAAAPAILAVAEPGCLEGALFGPLADLVRAGYDAQWVTVDAALAGACFSLPQVFLLAAPADSNGPAVGTFGEHTALATLIPEAGWSDPEMGLFGPVPFVGRLPAAGALRGDALHGLGEFGVAGLHHYLGAMLDDGGDQWADRFGWSPSELRRARRMLGRALGAPTLTGLGSAILVAAQGGGPRPAEALLPSPTIGAAPRRRGRRRATLADVVAGLDQSPPAVEGDREPPQQALPGMSQSDVARSSVPMFQWGPFAPAIARHAHVTGELAPAPLLSEESGQGQLAEAFVDWVLTVAASDHFSDPGRPAAGPSPQLLLAVQVLAAIGSWRGTWA
ncbi:hypothetical protein MUG78_17480 [Gordonia alkaliphila]|uniref:hypothetical protein n=1 Tax=Gordonia alkaliphila TaxID=1053547 RepID=UPI001FF6C3DC|nr:hypothetical protein [Gordonia alkaliphila]MCK0441193.1 hypothetical protein [Gordonia alkaliphila]